MKWSRIFKGIICWVLVGVAFPLTCLEPQLSCERKWGEMEWEGLTFHRYCLRAKSFPQDKKFHLIVKSYGGIQTETFTYLANRKGHLILQPKEGEKGDLYAVCPVKKGEKLTFIMRSEDLQEEVSVDVIPFPIQMKSRKGVELTLELQGEKGEEFSLRATHLKKGEKVSLSYQYGGKQHGLTPVVNEHGELVTTLTFPNGESGKAQLILKREEEEILVNFDWGESALKWVGACCLQIK